MRKQFLIYLILSIFIVLFGKYVHHLIAYIAYIYSFIRVKLGPFFSQGVWGMMLRNILILIIAPIIIAAIPALGYRLIKGREMPHFFILIWIIWIIIVFSTILVR